MPAAIAAYRAALLDDPDYKPASDKLHEIGTRHFELSYAKLREGNCVEAVVAADIAFDAQPQLRQPNLLYNFAGMLIGARNYTRASAILEEVIGKDPTKIEYYCQSAFVIYHTENWERAVAMLWRGLRAATPFGGNAQTALESLCVSTGSDFSDDSPNHLVPVSTARTENFADFAFLQISPDGESGLVGLTPLPQRATFVARVSEVDLVGPELTLCRNVTERLVGYNAAGGNFELRRLMWVARHLHQQGPEAIVRHDAPEGAIAFASDVSSNYYHWIFDDLCRMELIELFPELSRLPLLYPTHGPPFVGETLEMLDWPGGLLPIGPAINRFRRLHVPSLFWPEDAGAIARSNLEWLRKRFAKWRKGDGAKRVFLARGTASRRRVLNEVELLARLEGYGFVALQLEDMSVRDQIAALSSAEIVVAPHGAGLTNLAYCPEGVSVVELASEGSLTMPVTGRSLFCQISAHLNGRHAIMLGRISPEAHGGALEDLDPMVRALFQHNVDFSIDERLLLLTLDRLHPNF